MKHFSAATAKSLARKGIQVVGIQAVLAFEGDVYFQATAYMLDDNGVGRLRSFAEVLALAGRK